MSYLDWCKTPAGIQWLDILEYRTTQYSAHTYYTEADLLRIYSTLETNRMYCIQQYVRNIMHTIHSTICRYYEVVFSNVIFPEARNSWKVRAKLPYDLASAISYVYSSNNNIENYSYFTTSNCQVTCTCWYYARGEYAPNRTRVKPCEYHTYTSCCMLSRKSSVTTNVSEMRNNRPFDLAGYYRLTRRKRRIDEWYESIIKRIHEELEVAFMKSSTISDCFQIVLRLLTTSSVKMMTRAVPL
jgi:hypothetical protein